MATDWQSRDGGFLDPAVERYVTGLVPAREPAMVQMERQAEARHLPIVGPLEGQLLYVLALASGARTVLELGTCTGYSAAWLGRAVRDRDGKVLTLEKDPGRARESRENVERLGLGGVVEVRQGDALAILAGLTEQFDLVFNDLTRSFPDEEQMRRLFELLLARVRPGGLMVADNALYAGAVVEPSVGPGPRAVDLYNRLAAEHPGLATVVLPLRDGVCVSYVRVMRDE